MLADELLLMLNRGFTLQYRQPSVSSYQSKTLYESPIPRSRTHTPRNDTGMDLWGGSRNAELGAWNGEA
jgi:hypothetical protein